MGYDNALGYLKDGFQSWIDAGKESDIVASVTAEELAGLNKNNQLNILDVRKVSEYNSEHIENAINAPLDTVNDSMMKINKDKTYYVHCLSGYRSMVFVSILQARGYRNLINVEGGFNAIKATGDFKITDYVCPSTML